LITRFQLAYDEAVKVVKGLFKEAEDHRKQLKFKKFLIKN